MYLSVCVFMVLGGIQFYIAGNDDRLNTASTAVFNRLYMLLLMAQTWKFLIARSKYLVLIFPYIAPYASMSSYLFLKKISGFFSSFFQFFRKISVVKQSMFDTLHVY